MGKKNYDINEKLFIVFSNTSYAEENDSVKELFTKKIIVAQNLEIQFKVNELSVNLSERYSNQFNSLVNSLEMVKKFINSFHSLRVCNGASLSDELSTLHCSSYTYTDNFNKIRHRQCELINKSDQCEKCKTMKKTLRRKKKRQFTSYNGISSRIRIKCDNLEVKEQLQQLKRDCARKNKQCHFFQ